MKKNIYVIIIMFLSLYSCTKENTDIVIEKYIETNCNFSKCDSCYLSLNKVFNTDFDTMYIFSGYPVSKDVFKYVLNVSYNHQKENSDGDQIVLLKNNKIVYDNYWIHNKVEIEGGMDFKDIKSNKVVFDGQISTFSYSKYVGSSYLVKKIISSDNTNYYYIISPKTKKYEVKSK